MFIKRPTDWKDPSTWVKQNGIYVKPGISAKENNSWILERNKDDYALVLGSLNNQGTALTFSAVGLKPTKIDVFRLNANREETLVETWDYQDTGSNFSRSPAASTTSEFLFKFQEFDFGTTPMATQSMTMLNAAITDVVSFGTNYKGLIYPRLSSEAVGSLPFVSPHKNIRSLAAAFIRATLLHPSIADIDVSLITDFSGCFQSTKLFNVDISRWNTAKAVTMAGMFRGSKVFNQDISSWDTSNVKNMSTMFYRATAFNKNISGWNVAKVTDWTEFRYQGGLSSANTPLKFR